MNNASRLIPTSTEQYRRTIKAFDELLDAIAASDMLTWSIAQRHDVNYYQRLLIEAVNKQRG
jgi:hypothetical protein